MNGLDTSMTPSPDREAQAGSAMRNVELTEGVQFMGGNVYLLEPSVESGFESLEGVLKEFLSVNPLINVMSFTPLRSSSIDEDSHVMSMMIAVEQRSDTALDSTEH